MHPVIFEVDLFGLHFPIYGYGLMIMLGAFAAYFYISHQAKKQLDIPNEKILTLSRIIIITAFLGGKLLYYLEDPGYYFIPPSNMLKNFQSGFVFYGSLLFAVPSVIWYVRKNQIPTLPFLDIIAIAAVVLHAFGRSGCFLAGCCYGIPSDGPFTIQFTHQLSRAPLHQDLHPTQLYSVTLLLSILVILIMLKRHQRFKGQLFLVYLVLYSIGRGIIEIFRGDEARGYIIEGYLSHSQFISILLIMAVIWYYVRLSKKAQTSPD